VNLHHGNIGCFETTTNLTLGDSILATKLVPIPALDGRFALASVRFLTVAVRYRLATCRTVM
jgi:hypothetical protein